MLRLTTFRPRTMLPALVAAGCAGLLPAAARADDCKLSVQASPKMIQLGQSTQVNTFAAFPSSAYAFAGAEFDMHSTHPSWSFASSGAIVGNDVLGINVSQPHHPPTGVFADPTNPFRVWHGVLTPTTAAPALIEVSADPAAFYYYPSKLTSSFASCDAGGGSDWVFLNAKSVGKWAAAPGVGTSTTVHDDVIVDGQIITGENYDTAILIGLLVPAVQNCAEAEARVKFDGMPETFSVAVQTAAGDVPTTTFTLNYSRIDFQSGPMPSGMAVCMGDGSVRHVSYGAYLGGIYVATGDLDSDLPGPNPSLVVESVPQVIAVCVGSGNPKSGAGKTHLPGPTDGANFVKPGMISPSLGGGSMLTWTLRYDEPVPAIVRGPNGQPQLILLDTLEVRTAIDGSARKLGVGNNLKQIGLACHLFEATGVERMSITPKQPN